MAGPEAETEIKRGRPRASREPGAEPCVEVRGGTSSGQRIMLGPGTHVIGRGAEADIRLDDGGISRAHAKLVLAEGGIVNLVDLDSTNGTYLNGAPVDVGVVREGDRIHVGPDVSLRFTYEGADAEPPATPEPSPAPTPREVPLSPRELEVAQLVAEGLTNAEVGKRLFISPRTVTTHLVKIYERLGIHSRTALTRWVLEHGLLRKP